MSLPEFNVFVLSLPRSGSSMMMGICEKLGVNMVYTSDTEEEQTKREKGEQQRYGNTYRMNPAFYEITKDQFANWMKIMQTPYSGCKAIIPVNGWRWGAVLYQPAKVIMMWRDPEEVRQSQEASYARARAKVADYDPESVRAFFRTSLVSTKIQLDKAVEDKKLLAWMECKYTDMRENPQAEVENVAAFIEAPNPVDDAVASVKPELTRFKREELEVGI